MVRPHDAELEEVEDAIVDGDVAYQRGTAQAALRHRELPHRLLRHVRLQHRHVDADRHARRLRVEAVGLAELRRAHLLRPARAAVVPVDHGRAARRHPRPAPAPRHLADRDDGVLVRARRARPARRPAEGRARRARVRDRDRQRDRRARPERDPADARAARRPRRRDRAPVGADELVSRDRPGDRRRALRDVRRGAGVRDQRRSRTSSRSSGCCGRRTRVTRTRTSKNAGSAGCSRA